MTKKQPKADDPKQSKRFLEIAREVGASGDKESFARALTRIAREPPKRKKEGKRSSPSRKR